MPTIIRDFLPDRFPREKLPRFARLWTTAEELAAVDYDLAEQLVTPAEVGWGYAVDTEHEFVGRDGLRAEADAGGPARLWRGLRWDSEDVGELFAAQFRDAPAPPPPDLPWGQFRMQYQRVRRDGEPVGWASAATYSPNLRRMISNARVDRDLPVGTGVTIDWGFPGYPTWRLRATVVEQPFIAQRRRDDLTAAPAGGAEE
jgi:vanillate/3-O-methylgallate O-demethylase